MRSWLDLANEAKYYQQFMPICVCLSGDPIPLYENISYFFRENKRVIERSLTRSHLVNNAETCRQ